MTTTAQPSNPFRRAWPLFVLGMAIGLTWLVQWPLQAVRDYRTLTIYQPAVCTVLATRVLRSSTSSYLRGRGWTTRESSFPEVTFTYQVGGRQYTVTGYDNYDGSTSDASVLVGFTSNATVPCWYDPARPERAVLARTWSWAYYASGLIPLALTVIPGNFLLLALRRRPLPSRISTSAGTTYPVRLAPEFTHRQALVAQAIIAVLLGAGLGVYSWYRIRADGLLGLIGDSFPFFYLLLAAGDGYLFWRVWLGLQTAGLPNPIVEVEREPVRPGETAAMVVRIPGPISFIELKVTLISETKGPRGTHTAVRHGVFTEARGDVMANDWYTRTATLEIPADADSSEQRVDGSTTWKIVLRLKAAGGGSLQQEYPLRVVAREPPA